MGRKKHRPREGRCLDIEGSKTQQILTCPKCGFQGFEEVLTGAIVLNGVDRVMLDEDDPDAAADVRYTHDVSYQGGETESIRCAECEEPLRFSDGSLVASDEDLAMWIRLQALGEDNVG